LISLKSNSEINKMRRAGRILSSIFPEIYELVKPGAVTRDIDDFAEQKIRQADAKPAFKGYKANNGRAFPATTCISINQEIVHGIPSGRKLKSGQIVGIDCGCVIDGWYADMAGSFLVDEVVDTNKKLWWVTREALYRGIQAARPGNRLSDIGRAIQDWVESNGFSVIRDLVGHGIGTNLHEDPAVYNYYSSQGNCILKSGMTIAIEPMVSAGRWKIKTLRDGWTAVTVDGSHTGHFEHTVHITDNEPEILTLLEDGSDPWLTLFKDSDGE